MPVELTKRDDCALLRLNRPEALNALSFSILGEIAAAIDEVATWKVRALVVTGAGEKAFCAGADIKELRGRSMMARKGGAELGQAAFAKIEGGRDQWFRFRRWVGVGACVHLPACDPECEAWLTGDQAWAYSRLWRNAAPTSPYR